MPISTLTGGVIGTFDGGEFYEFSERNRPFGHRDSGATPSREGTSGQGI